MIEILLFPLRFLAFNPIAVFIAAGVFTIPCRLKFYSKNTKIILSINAILWWIYGFYELFITLFHSSGEPIRVDILLAGPILISSGIVSVIVSLVDLKKKHHF